MKISDGMPIRRGWGVAYQVPDDRRAVILPIPLNVIVRAFRVVWWRFMQGVFPSRVEQMVSKAWQMGYNEAAEFHFGQGYEACQRAVSRALDELQAELRGRNDVPPKRNAAGQIIEPRIFRDG